MSDWLFGGVFGGVPVDGFGAQQQQASADYFRRQQEGMLNAWRGGLAWDPPAPARIVATMGPPPPEMLAEARALYRPDTLFWKMLAMMASLAFAFWAFTH